MFKDKDKIKTGKIKDTRERPAVSYYEIFLIDGSSDFYTRAQWGTNGISCYLYNKKDRLDETWLPFSSILKINDYEKKYNTISGDYDE